MALGWKFQVYRTNLGDQSSVKALYVVAIADQVAAVEKLRSSEKFLDERIQPVGEADQALLDEWELRPGEVFCVVAWS